MISIKSLERGHMREREITCSSTGNGHASDKNVHGIGSTRYDQAETYECCAEDSDVATTEQI